jgi:ribosomal protein S18 acetylase RimI-like enzyme
LAAFSIWRTSEVVITIRRIKTGEADLFRQIRLKALQEAPYAFSSTYDSALRRSAESWREQAEGSTQGSDRATFMAFSEGLPVGITALYRREGQADAGEVLQVWVAPEFRGTRVAWDLMDVVFKWAGENNFRRIVAGVTKVNTRALRFYSKYGFSVIDEVSPEGANIVSLMKKVQ